MALSSRAVVVTLLALLLVLAPILVRAELAEVAETRELDFELSDTHGRLRTLEEFAGNVVIVHFWASWCAPCVREFPNLLRLRDAFRDQPLIVVGINVAEGRRRVQTASKRLGLDFPVLLDRGQQVFAAWGATVIPATYVFDRSGKLRYVGHGPLQWDASDIAERLTMLLR